VASRCPHRFPLTASIRLCEWQRMSQKDAAPGRMLTLAVAFPSHTSGRMECRNRCPEELQPRPPVGRGFCLGRPLPSVDIVISRSWQTASFGAFYLAPVTKLPLPVSGSSKLQPRPPTWSGLFVSPAGADDGGRRRESELAERGRLRFLKLRDDGFAAKSGVDVK
jgi:hypothetical protein